MTTPEHDRELTALGQAIRDVRAKRGIEPRELAITAGIERERLDAIEHGRCDPTYDVLLALADALGVELSALVIRAAAVDKRAACAAFGRRLTDLRTEHGVSQDRLSDRAGIHRTAIGKIERGGSDPRLTTILSLSQGLGVTPGTLVEGLTATRSEA